MHKGGELGLKKPTLFSNFKFQEIISLINHVLIKNVDIYYNLEHTKGVIRSRKS